MANRTRKRFKAMVKVSGKILEHCFSCAGRKGAEAQAVVLAGPMGKVLDVSQVSTGSQRTSSKNKKTRFDGYPSYNYRSGLTR